MNNFISCTEIARRYGVKLTTVKTWIRGKQLPAFRFGKNYVVSMEDLEKFENLKKTINLESKNHGSNKQC